MTAPPVGPPPGGAEAPLLEVEGLHVRFFSRNGVVQAVRGVSFEVGRGQTVGIVGESGSGKSVTSQAILGMVESPGRIVAGDVRWKGRSLLHGPDAAAHVRRIRGRELSMVYQDPMTSLDPLFTIGHQIREVVRHHLGYSRRQAQERAVELLDLVGINAPRRRCRQYPHEFSGGMRQRVLIAMALACEPELVIADEPTTALDVTIQAQIFELLADVQARLGLAVLLITHDLAVVADICEEVVVLYGGTVLERAPAQALFDAPMSPYSSGLLEAMPRLDVRRHRLVAIEGVPPDLRRPPPGCPFAPRCVRVAERCEAEMPPLGEVAPGHHLACWHPLPAAGADVRRHEVSS